MRSQNHRNSILQFTKTHFSNSQSYLDLGQTHKIEIDSCSYFTQDDFWTHDFQMSSPKVSIYLVSPRAGMELRIDSKNPKYFYLIIHPLSTYKINFKGLEK